MNVLFASFEVSPYAKIGGLGDVAGSLPLSLAENGVNIVTVMPKYGRIPREYADKMEYLCNFHIRIGFDDKYVGVFSLTLNNYKTYFIDNEEYFGGAVYGYGGDAEVDRCVFFCRAAIEFLEHIGFSPDIIHVNDWHTALIPPLLRAQYPQKMIRTLLTIHNLKYQGIFDIGKIKYLTGLPDSFFTTEGLEYYGGANLLKGGIVYSDRVNTVSPRYAEETLSPEFGEGLEGVLRAKGDRYSGILNGLDYGVFSPETDGALARNFSAGSLEGKAVCKNALCSELGLEAEKLPLVAVISRLVDQKGFDILCECIDALLSEGCFAFCLLGSGEKRYEEYFSSLSRNYPGRAVSVIRYDGELASRIYAGADIFLMPSRFEPCGLSQLIAMRYGAIPVVRETGGLRDTVKPYDESGGTGYGFTFAPYAAHDLDFTLRRAVNLYKSNFALWKELTVRAMRQDFSWKKSAKLYTELYASMIKQHE